MQKHLCQTPSFLGHPDETTHQWKRRVDAQRIATASLWTAPNRGDFGPRSRRGHVVDRARRAHADLERRARRAVGLRMP